jgi:hypothetical protein
MSTESNITNLIFKYFLYIITILNLLGGFYLVFLGNNIIIIPMIFDIILITFLMIKYRYLKFIVQFRGVLLIIVGSASLINLFTRFIDVTFYQSNESLTAIIIISKLIDTLNLPLGIIFIVLSRKYIKLVQCEKNGNE